MTHDSHIHIDRDDEIDGLAARDGIVLYVGHRLTIHISAPAKVLEIQRELRRALQAYQDQQSAEDHSDAITVERAPTDAQISRAATEHGATSADCASKSEV